MTSTDNRPPDGRGGATTDTSTASAKSGAAAHGRAAKGPEASAPEAVKSPITSPAGTAKNPLLSWKLLAGFIGVALLLVVSLFTGVYDVFGGDGGAEMFQITRVPRTIALVLSGAAMAMCGLVMQLLTQNRFVEPTTTGTTEWAGLGLMLTVIIYPDASILARMIGAVFAAFIGTLVFFMFLRRVSLKSSLIVPIIGIMLGAVVGAISTFIAVQTDMLQSLGIWFAGSFTSILRGQYEILWVVVIVVIAVFITADRFTVAGLGKEVATNVGLNYNQVILIGTILVAIATGVVTVVVGSLPFLGLIVPNIVSMIRGDDLRSNLPWVCLLGIAIVTICDLIGRVIIMPFELPVSVILGVVGAAVFVALLLRQRKRG
ncbi:ABC transporter permease [Brevibacterium sp. FME17]|uniref:ABC transporter permease n=1 Tax=Brevibacterium sp. FME17 TaxID=2742606 RepID=UPI001D009A3C|nr:ABC transporter permease [Brevibacterium sp. FME17]